MLLIICDNFYGQAANVAIQLKNNLFKIVHLSPFQQYFGKVERIILTSLQKFNEKCIVTNNDKIEEKSKIK